jgi:hypothetical protein
VLSCFLFFNFVYLFFSTGRVRVPDELLPAYQTESLALHRTLAIPQALQTRHFYGMRDRWGNPQAPYPPGQAIATLPWYEIGWLAVNHLPGVSVRARRIFTDFFQVSSSATFSALAVAAVLLVFLRLGIEARASFAGATILALATPLAGYSGWFFSEPLATVFLLGAAAVLFARPRDETIPVQAAVVAGLLLGAAVWVRATHVIVVPVFIAAIVVRDGRKGIKAAITLAGLVAAVSIAFLLRNFYLFGSPFQFGYPSTVDGKQYSNSLKGSLLQGLSGFLFAPGKSVFIFSPPIFLALWGVPRLWRRDRGLTIVATAPLLVYLLLFSKYMQWEGGYSWGPRYLVPPLALAGLTFGPALADKSRGVRWTAILTSIAGFVIQALGLATNYIETQQRGDYYDAQFNYQFSYLGPLEQARLFLHYAKSPASAPLGNGFDRWWLFLSKAGVAPGTVAALMLFVLLGMAVSAWCLGREYEKLTRLAVAARRAAKNA